MGQTALLPLRRKACWEFFFFAIKNPTASAGFEPANLGTKGQHATSRPPKSGIHVSVATNTYRSFATTVSQPKICDFSGQTFYRIWIAIISYECNDDTTALQRRVLQTALWHYNLFKSISANVSFYTINSKNAQILSCVTLFVVNERHVPDFLCTATAKLKILIVIFQLHAPATLLHNKDPPITFSRRQIWPLNRSGRNEGQQISLPLPEVEPRFLDYPGHRPLSIPTEPSRLLISTPSLYAGNAEQTTIC
jgi:hypothetical protein